MMITKVKYGPFASGAMSDNLDGGSGKMTQIHDSNHCDCEMCQFAHKSTEKPLKSASLTYYGHERLDTGLGALVELEAENHSEDDSTQVSPIPAAPDFDHEWREAPKWATRTTERDSAEFWFLRGTIAEQLRQTQESNRVFREMAKRRGLL